MGRRRRPRVSDDLLRIENERITADSAVTDQRGEDSSAQASLFSLRDVLEKLSLAIAPPTLVIALAFWFGWTLTNARSDYFGIDSSVLGYSTTDYVLRSADAAFVPIAVTLLVILVATVFHGLTQHAVIAAGSRNLVKRGASACIALGAALTFFGVWGMFEPLPIATNYLLPPILLGSGPALAAYSVWTRLHVRAVEKKEKTRVVPSWERAGYVVAVMITVLGIFWAASLYAAALGRGRAELLAESLTSRPAVTVFSERALDIDAPGVIVTKIADADSEYRFRYTGLRLLVHSANKYFLVNDRWSREHGVTIVLDDTPDIRLEFAPGLPGGKFS
jgi:hypothetical protein